MIFAKLDVCFWRHKKFVRAGLEASCYWACALAYLREDESSTGLLEFDVLGLLHGVGEAKARKLCERLVEIELFARHDRGYVLLGYTAKNETKEQIAARRAAVAARVATSRAKRGNGGGNGVHGSLGNSGSNALQARAVPGSDSHSGSEIREGDLVGSTGEAPSHTRLRNAPERYIEPADAITDELREAAKMATVQDVDGAWLKFCGKYAGQWRHVAGAWQAFCVSWAKVERSERERARGAPEPPEAAAARKRAIDEAQAKRDAEDREHAARAVPPPPDLLKKIGVKR